jgi:DNA-binding NarL/FixJ family response regulator|tara:strand:+ start:46 stop:465 length:420 start_codon:yes stop_codon:yes gene_type:complete
MQKPGDEVTLLLIEDDDIDAMTVERSFKKNRIANPIVRAHDGRDALEMLQNKKINRPYVILLDLQMPRMNGIEFLEALRADKELAHSVVFILTTSKAEEDMIASYEKNIAGYFLKDESGDNFIDLINVLDSYWKVVHFP